MGQELPFQWAHRQGGPGLWYELTRRKAALEAQQRMPAGLNPARAGGDAVVTAEPEGIPDPWTTIQEAGIRTPVGDGAAEVHQVSSRTRARSSPAVSRRWNKISGAGWTSSISGGDNHEQDQDTAGLTSSSISSFDVRPAGLPSGMGTGDSPAGLPSGMWTGDSRERFLAELRRPPAREPNVGGMDSRHS